MTLFAADLQPAASLDGGAGELARLEQEAAVHAGVHHPWLQHLAGTSHGAETAMRQFAREYHGYVAWLPRLFERALPHLQPVQQIPWQRRLARELGFLGDDELAGLRRIGVSPHLVQGTPRRMLFDQFALALGLDEGDLAPTRNALAFRQQLLEFLTDANAAEAVGALWLGTELVEADAHGPVLRCLLELGTVRHEALPWFEMTCAVDAQHHHELRGIARSLAATPGGLAGLERGMQLALGLRATFFDRLAAALPQPV